MTKSTRDSKPSKDTSQHTDEANDSAIEVHRISALDSIKPPASQMPQIKERLTTVPRAGNRSSIPSASSADTTRLTPRVPIIDASTSTCTTVASSPSKLSTRKSPPTPRKSRLKKPRPRGIRLAQRTRKLSGKDTGHSPSKPVKFDPPQPTSSRLNSTERHSTDGGLLSPITPIELRNPRKRAISRSKDVETRYQPKETKKMDNSEIPRETAGTPKRPRLDTGVNEVPSVTRNADRLDKSTTTTFTDDPVKTALTSFSRLNSRERWNFLLTLSDLLRPKELLDLQKHIEPRINYDIISMLPIELSRKILGSISPRELLTCAQVCKRWNTIASDTMIWKDICAHDDVVDGTCKDHFLSKQRAQLNWVSDAYHNSNHNLPQGLEELSLNTPRPTIYPGEHPALRTMGPNDHIVAHETWIKNKNPHMIHSKCHEEGVITCLTYDGSRIISASDDGTMCVFEEKMPKVRASLPTRQSQRLQGRNVQRETERWEAAKNENRLVLKGRLQGHIGGVWCICTSGDVMISGSTDREIRVWNLLSLECQAILRGHFGTVRCLDIYTGSNPASRHKFVSGSRDNTLRLWSYDTPQPAPRGANDTVTRMVRQLEFDFPPSSPDTATTPNADMAALRVMNGHSMAVRCVKWSPCGKKIVSGAYDFTVRIWNVENNEGRCLHVLQGHVNRVYSLEVSPCGRYIFSGGLDSFIRIWEMNTGHCKFQLAGHQSLTSALVVTQTNAFSRPIRKLDGRVIPGKQRLVLFSANADSTVRVWDVDSGQCLNIIGTRVDRGGIPFGTLNVSPVDEQMLVASGLEMISLSQVAMAAGNTNGTDANNQNNGEHRSADAVTSIEIVHCPYTLPELETQPEASVFKMLQRASSENDSNAPDGEFRNSRGLDTYRASRFPNLLLVTSLDDGTVRLYDAVSGRFLRKLVTLNSGNNGAVVWRIKVRDNKLVCAGGSRNFLLDTQVMLVDFNDRSASVV